MSITSSYSRNHSRKAGTSRSRSLMAATSGSFTKIVQPSSYSDVSGYLPPFAYAVSQAPEVSNVGFSIHRNPVTGKVEYKMRVDWTDITDGPTRKWAELTTKMDKEQLSDASSGPFSEVVCDGPCGRTVTDGSDMMQYGVCDHNICLDCYRTQKNVQLFDGTPGCCNTACVKHYMNERYHRTDTVNSLSRRSRKSMSSLDVTTGDKPCEVYLVKFVIFEKGVDRKVSRRVVDRQLRSKDRMDVVLGILGNLVPDLDESRVYYTTVSAFRRKDLINLRFDSFGMKSLESITSGQDTLIIVVLNRGVSIKQQ